MGLQLPDYIGSHWDLSPDRAVKASSAVAPLPNSWRLTIAKLSPWIVGICWTHSGRPFHGVSLEENHVRLAVGVIMELLPYFVDSFVLELDSFFLKTAKSPSESDWNQHFLA